MLCINTVIIGIETDYSRGRALEECMLRCFVLARVFWLWNVCVCVAAGGGGVGWSVFRRSGALGFCIGFTLNYKTLHFWRFLL